MEIIIGFGSFILALAISVVILWLAIYAVTFIIFGTEEIYHRIADKK